MSPDAITVQDARDHLPVFIDREIDDCGLDVYAVRIYLTLSRRAGRDGAAWESVPNMAARVGMSERRARDALRDLEAAGVIAGRPRIGETTVYALTPKSAWRLPEPRHHAPPRQDVPPTPAPGAGVPRQDVPPTPAPGAAEGTPLKVPPLKVPPSTSTSARAITEPPPSEAEVEVEHELSKATNAAERRRARSHATSLLAQQHPEAHAGLQDLQSVYSWRPAQYGVIAEQVLTLARDHGGGRVAAAIDATLGSGAEIRQPLTYIKKILEGSRNGGGDQPVPTALRSLDDVLGGRA